MAGAGAYITSTTSASASIFDVIAQASLLETLQPALSHVLKVLAETNPGKYGFLHRYSNEVFLALHLMLERHYLKNYGASFSENFYDLKRIPFKESDGKEPLQLPRSVVLKSLAALVIFPYVKNVLEEKYRKMEENSSNDNTVLGKIFLKIWPVFHMSWETLTLVYYIRYVTGQQKVHSPLLHICGAFLSYLTPDDFECIEDRADNTTFADVRSLKSFIHWSSERFGNVLQNSLEVGAFFLQFLDTFYTNNPTSRISFSSSSIPSPPEKTRELHSVLEENVCPICRQGIRHPTALTTSGVAFCYSCILVHLKKNTTCPVTGYPSTTKQLVKIYIDDS